LTIVLWTAFWAPKWRNIFAVFLKPKKAWTNLAFKIKDGLRLLQPIRGGTHAERMESYYEKQASSYDATRRGFLHGREILMKECARLTPPGGIWVDVGGGTASNVVAMSRYRKLETFDRIYVVDISPAMCQTAREALQRAGVTNAEVVCEDAAVFTPPQQAALITFSYSLSMIPDYRRVIEHVVSYLSPAGCFGAVDFFAVGLWRSWFKLDHIDVGPERRAYLSQRLDAVFDCDAKARIRWFPLLKVPFYVSVKAPKTAATPSRPRFIHEEGARPSWGFGKTFIYNISFEDPDLDRRHLSIGAGDRVLMLTSGGCNAFEWLLADAHVTTVDINPCQNFLMELKCAVVEALGDSDIWKVLGEGRHENGRQIFEEELQWRLSPPARDFWRRRLGYFKSGIYNHGGAGSAALWLRRLVRLTSRKGHSLVDRLMAVQSIDEQVELWRTRLRPVLIESGMLRILANPLLLWFWIGVPRHQWNQVVHGRSLEAYLDTVCGGLAANIPLPQNYFWRWFWTGKFERDVCPSFLQPDNIQRLKDGRLSRLQVQQTTFLQAAGQGGFTRMILGDHLDWFGPEEIEQVVDGLAKSLEPGAKLSFLTSSAAPAYAEHFRARGLSVEQRGAMNPYMDRMNTYEGYYIVTKS
jgi:betaine lipid synthase